MGQRHGQYEKTFALLAADPGAWVEQAQGMAIAAEPIHKSLIEILHESQNRPGIRLRKLAYVRAYMLLMGFGFENLLKGIAVKRGLLETNPKLTFRGLSHEKGGHCLTGLARSLELALTPDEKQYLERLEEYVHWAGRYPVSLTPDTYVGAHSASRLSFITSDPTLGGILFDRLVKLAHESSA
jgi:hypothetical protein